MVQLNLLCAQDPGSQSKSQGGDVNPCSGLGVKKGFWPAGPVSEDSGPFPPVTCCPRGTMVICCWFSDFSGGAMYLEFYGNYPDFYTIGEV